MILKYNMEVNKDVIIKNLDRIINQIFKLLPSREEGNDWQTPLQNLIIEIVGMNKLLPDHVDLFPLLCKLEALKTLTEETDFMMFRKVIFEVLGILSEIKKCLD